LRIVTEATVEIVARLFYAQHNTIVPMFAFMGWLGVNIVLAYLLVDELGIVALAVASTVAFTLLAALLFFLNSRALGGLGGRALAGSAARATAATVGMSVVILVIGMVVDQPLLYLLIGSAAGGATYLALSFFLGGMEIQHLLVLVRSK